MIIKLRKMGEMQKIEKLKAARDILRSSLEKSKDLAFHINETGPRLERMSQRLALLETTMNTISTKCNLYKIKAPLNHAFGLSASIVNMFEVICDLEITLLAGNPSSSSGLFSYLNTVKYTEDALKFLSGYCKLAIPWLKEVQQILENDKSISDHWYLKNVKKCLLALEELEAMEGSFRLKGGALVFALDKLESEFATLLLDNPPMDSFDTSLLPLPLPVLEKIQAIVERLAANDRLENCISVYVEIQSSNVRETLQELDLDYLEMTLTEFDSLQSVEDRVDKWGKDLEFAVKYVFEIEHRLSSEVFQKLGSDVWLGCFAKIAVQSGIQSFFKFGNEVARGKKEAIKLLKLLDIFAALNKLRSDFNRLFKGKACGEIQNQTRDLIKKVVDGACEIFWELSLQVELQIPSNPPSDCGVPKLVTFVTDFCNQLLEEDYWLTLLQVVEIHQGWNHKRFDRNLLPDEIHSIVISLEKNLEKWAGEYKDTALSCLFMMNTNWYLCKYTKGTKLGNLMGHEWLRRHEEYMEYYESVYLKESWGRLPALLSNDDMELEEFTEAFDSLYKRQFNVVLCDKGLRWRICELVLQAVVFPYKSYVEKYVSYSIDVKYTGERLESMISSLFQPKFVKLGGNTKCTEFINNVIANPISSTPAAA